MENKSNSLSRVKRHQREKVLRFSIRKYSFGAASVAVAALMFLGARVASADSVIENNSQNTTDVHNQKEKNKSLAEIQQPTAIKVEAAQNPLEKKTTTKNENVVKVVDKAKLKKVVEELKTTLSSKSDLDKSVISPIKDRVQKGQALLDSDTATQKDVDELLSLLESDLTVLSNATKESNKVQETATENKTEIKDNKITSELSEADKSTSQNKEADKSTTEKKESLKLSTDQLQAALLDLPENETTKEVLEKANEVLSLAQGLLTNTRVTSNELEDLNQRVKRTFNSVKIATLRLTSGKNDPRNGNKIEEGTNVRAASISSRWDSSDNLLIYQRHRASDGSRVVRNGLREYTEKKVDMFAKTTTIDGERYVVYDVFFNNDGASMAHLSRYQIYRLILPPQILDLTSEGLYKGNTLRDLKFETYTRNGNSGTLSQNPENFTRTATHNVNFLNNSTDYGSGWRKLTYFNALDIRHNGEYNRDMRDTFKGNSNDPLLIHAVTRTESKFNRYSYGFGVKTEDRDSAIHMQVKAKLKAGVTDDQVREAFALAVVGTFGLTTNQAYTFISGKDASEPKYTDYPDQPVQPTLREKQAKLYPIQGSRHTKVVGDTIPNTGNPVADKYITRKGSGDFPAGMSWSWEGNNSPSTANAGKFTYTAIARYQDGSTSKDANSGSDGKVHFTVNPKKPTITTSVVNKKGLTNQTIEVNVGSGVKNGSVVKLYDGDRVIGQGTSNGTTARITVSGALPGNPLKAETTVDNGGVVVSEKSDPVTPTEAPDTQAPTLAITPANQTVVEGQNVTFTVTARDNKHVNLDANDFLTKYGTRVFSGKASVTSPTDTDTEKIRTITITTTAEDVGKTNTITFNATDNANHRAAPVSFTFTVTKRDNIPPTITAGNATVTSREQITPISVTAVDNTGGVGMRDNNPIEVTGLPSGLTYANNRITGTPTGAPGNSTVTIKAYDKNGNMATKTITITVRSQADAHNPTGAGLTVNQNHTITDAELKAKVSNAGPGTLSIVSRPSTANAGNAGNAVVKVTYPDGTFDNVNVPVTVTDVTGPTITAESATVTKNESITPIPVTAVDNTGGVGMRDNNPIEVTNLPAGLRYANNQITGTPTAGVGYYTVTIKAYDKNNRLTTKQIRITVRSQADAHNPTGETLTVPYNHNITDDEVKAKVQNFAPGTLTVQSKPSTNTSGNVGNAVVKVTYPDGSHDTVNVPVVVGRPNKDDYTPKYNDGSGKPGESVEIPVSEANGKKIPTGTTYTSGTPGIITVDKTTGKVTVTIPSDKNPGDKVTGKVLVRYPDGSEEEVPVTVTVVNRDKDDYTPKYNDGSGKPGSSVEIPVSEANGKKIPTGTTYTSGTPGIITVDKTTGKVTVTIPSDKNPGDKVTGKVLVRYPDGSEEEVPVTVTVVNRDKDDYTPKYNDGSGKPGSSVEIPVSEANGKKIPTGTTYTSGTPGIITVDKTTGKVTVTIPSDKNPGDKVTGKVLVRYPDGSEEEVPVTVTVVNRDKDDYTPKYNDGSGKPGSSVEIPVSEANGKKIPTGTTYTSGTPGIITVDKTTGKVTVTIPSDKNPGDKVTGKVLVRYPDGSEEEVPVTVTVVNRDKDDYTPKYNDGSGKPGSSVEIPVSEANGKKIPTGTTYTSGTPGIITVDKTTGKVTVTIPSDKNPGDKVTGKVLVRYPDGSEEEVPVTVTVVNRDKDDYTPKYNDGSGKPGSSVEIPVSEANGKKIPTGTTYTSGTPGIITVDKTTGKVTVTIPSDKNPGDKVTGKVLVRYPDGSEEEVPVTVTVVNRDKDDYTPKYNDGSGKPGSSVEIPVSEANGKKIPTGTTYTSGTPGIITVDKTTGKVTVTIPSDKNPGDKVTGKVLVRYPDGSEEEVPVTVTVTTPARKTPTVDVEQDPKTGDVTVTPKKPDGSTYPPGTKVEIPGKDGNPITVTIGEDGKGKVPNSELPDGKVPGTGKITEPGKPAVEVPVETPAKVTPETPVTEKPGKIEITQQPNGNAIVTPKKPDGSTYPPGTKVEIPGEDGNTITVTIGDNGSGEVPNDNLPKTDIPGTGTVTEPNKKPSQPVDVTTPARKTPTLDVEQDPKTGDVTVTPKKPDGSTYPPGTKVEIPGKDGNPITVTIGEDGKGKVPNSELPDGKVPGTGKITEPGKPAVEVPVETPAKVTPETPVTEKPGKIEITQQPNGNAIVTPKKPDGSTYPPGTKVEIPGEDGNTITVTIGDNGSGEVPNDNLPKKDVPGTGTVTEPNKKPSQPVDVTTPARKTPTVDVEQDPKTGDVTVTPKKPDGSTYPPGTKVEIPGKDGNPITVTIGEDGKGKVPNSELPDGKVPGTGKIIEPGKPAVEVPVETPAKVTPETPVTEKPGKIEITQQPNGNAIVTPKKPDGSTYPPGTKVEIPGEDGNTITVTIGDNGSGEVPNDNLPKTDVPGTGTVTEPNKKPSQPVDVTTPARKTPTVDVEQDPKTGDVTVTPKKPDGSTYPPGTKVEIPGKDGNPITVTIGEDGKGKVPNSELPDGKVPGTGKITEPGKPAVEVPVETPAKVTPETPVTEKPGKIEITQQPNGNAIVTPKKPDGSTYPPGTKVEIPGEDGNTITVTIGDNGSGEVPNDNLPKKDVPGTGTVTEPNKKPSQPVDVTTPARKTPTVDVEQDPKTGDVTVTPKKPDGSTYPPGTKVEIPGKDGNPITVTIGEDGKGKVPNSELPDGKVPGTGKIIEPGKPAVEVPVETPAKVTPETPVTEKPGKIEITQQPNGNAIVTPKKPDGSTYPPGTKVEIPGEDGNTITVTIGDNGSGEVPNDNLPKKDVPGTGTVTEPNKKPSQPVDVTTPARKTPTVDVEQDPKTGDVTVTPKKPDGSTYPPGTKVEIPGKDGNPITVTIGEDGKGKVPNSELPDGKVPGTGKITEPGKPAVEVPVETPAKVTPETPVTEKPGKIEITQQPNGNAIVTPKKPDGSTYPPGTKVEIPGEDGNTITVTIGDNGSGEVPNDNLPKKDVPGTGTVTEPNKKPSQPVDVTTPARKTPTVDVEQDPKTGDVTVTPKKPDGSTYPPGTKVEIPGKDGNPITVTIGEDGKGKVPNSELPDGKVPGTGKITEPGKPAVEVPVETPAKVTPETLTPNADQVDTKNTNDNGAKSNDSQNVLPNTGTESNATLASLGLLGMLGGLGLALGKKKED